MGSAVAGAAGVLRTGLDELAGTADALARTGSATANGERRKDWGSSYSGTGCCIHGRNIVVDLGHAIAQTG